MSLVNVFTLPGEYKDLQDSLRALSEKEIAPFAHAVDEDHRYPQEAHNALVRAGLFAAHVPTEFGGDGADALATCIIIEEVARVCGSSSLIPAVNKLGSLPLILSGTPEQKERWLRPLAKGKGFSYCLSESEAGSDASALKTKAGRKGDNWVINGSKKWISNAGESEFYTVIAQTDASLGSKGITAFVLEKSDPGISFGSPEKKMGFRGSPTPRSLF
jgi:alkylation response protein AidB-like acyl-CoA dehydrogenase